MNKIVCIATNILQENRKQYETTKIQSVENRKPNQNIQRCSVFTSQINSSCNCCALLVQFIYEKLSF